MRAVKGRPSSRRVVVPCRCTNRALGTAADAPSPAVGSLAPLEVLVVEEVLLVHGPEPLQGDPREGHDRSGDGSHGDDAGDAREGP